MRFPALLFLSWARADGGLSGAGGQGGSPLGSHSGVRVSSPGNKSFTPALLLPAIPCWADRRPIPARAEAAAIVASAKEPRPAVIVLLAIVPIGGGIVGQASGGSLRAKHRNGVVGRLMIAGQEAISM